MCGSNSTDGSPIHDVIGIGFGPSNLALAVALEEHGDPTFRVTFLERQPSFGWHTGMLLNGATMQVSFLKDLVTMRNPASDFSFVSYLFARSRLEEFINGKTIFPLRREFHDYLEWAAQRVARYVRYGCEVLELRPVLHDGTVAFLDVVARDLASGDQVVWRARNVVLAPGICPNLPTGVVDSTRVWHSADSEHRLTNIDRDNPWRIAVVGAGQSAAEVVEHLYSRFPSARLDSIITRYGYSVADDNPLANAIFNSGAVDKVHAAPAAVRESLSDYHSNTNYGVVDLELSQHLHRLMYEESVIGTQRLFLRRCTGVRSVDESEDAVQVVLEDLFTGTRSTEAYDFVVFATGYRPISPLTFLGPLQEDCRLNSHGEVVLRRNYQVATSDAISCGIFVQGAAAERSHGLSAGLLSATAVRAGEIAAALVPQPTPRSESMAHPA